jgi:hypothetical protein
MAEDNNENLDIQGAQDFLTDLLDNQPNIPLKEEDSSIDDDERISIRDAQALEQFANLQNADEELDMKQVQKLIDFVGGDWKSKTPEELKEDELERLTKIAIVKAGHFHYNPKKKFDVQYKKKRQEKNKVARRQRAINRNK